MDNATLPPPVFIPFPDDGSGYDTDVVIVGLGPAGGVPALPLATYGVRVHAVTMFPWVANSPRAHITNQRAAEVLRDLGIEEEARKYATPWDRMGDTLFTTSLAGEEIVRLQTWGTGDRRSGDYLQGSPCTMLDIPQPLMEPLLIKNAAERGAIVSFNTEYIDHEQDADGVTVRFRNGRTGHVFTQRARYMRGFDIAGGEPDLSDDLVLDRIRTLVGDPDLEAEIVRKSLWYVNQQHATNYQVGRVFCGGDATHRHPPSSGLGSNTSVQDAFNLAWKVAFVVKGHAGPGLLDSYTPERAPVGKQIVARANQSRKDYAGLREGFDRDSDDPVRDGLAKLKEASPEGVARRERLYEALELKSTEFNAHGVELNQRYESGAVVPDPTVGDEVWPQHRELYLQATTRPGAKLPHAWLVGPTGVRTSTLDVVGKGRMTLLTGLAGQAW